MMDQNLMRCYIANQLLARQNIPPFMQSHQVFQPIIYPQLISNNLPIIMNPELTKKENLILINSNQSQMECKKHSPLCPLNSTTSQ